MNNQLILGDNLEVLKTFPSECVDLIYIDPPFFSNRHYEVIWGDKGEIASFNDRWAGGINHYIGWLYERVEELYRVLKPTGSFYLHCDWHANAYIRVMILDKIFGDKNFVNEIVWHYSGWNKKLKLGFEKRCDTLFFYAKTKQVTFNSVSRPWKDENEYIKVRNKKVYMDENGDKYLWSDGGSGKRVRRYVKDAMNYGRPLDNLWIDIDKINNNSKERIGYPTQKPEALLERIIKASSNEGDLVLDAFCGGGTTCAVARRLGRKFIGIDQSVRAIAVSKARLENQTDLVINDVYEVKTQKYSYDSLKNMDPLNFETFIVEQFGGIPNLKQRGDGGKDGIKRIDGVPVPIQVKQQESVGRPVLQAFVGTLMQSKSAKGFFIAFDFAKTAYEYVAEIKQNIGIDINLIKVEDIIPVIKASRIKIEWSYQTVDGKQEVTLRGVDEAGENIEMWQWDLDYDPEKGFAAEELKDYEGICKVTLNQGKHEIAVRGIDADGIESLAFITLYSNGSVHE